MMAAGMSVTDSPPVSRARSLTRSEGYLTVFAIALCTGLLVALILMQRISMFIDMPKLVPTPLLVQLCLSDAAIYVAASMLVATTAKEFAFSRRARKVWNAIIVFSLILVAASAFTVTLPHFGAILNELS